MPNAKKGYFKFEKLDVWNDARIFASDVYKITLKFPVKEQFGLTNQVRRAAVSVALNIAEGSVRGSDPDFKRFLKIAQGSLNEVMTGFYIAQDQAFISEAVFDRIYESVLKINARLNALIRSLSR